MSIIELQDVSKLYGFGDATTIALEEVSLSIDEGEFVAVMGPSGCGKSTLMNIIGLLDRPTNGVYNLRGRHVAKLRAGQRAKIRRDAVGFVFQSFNLLPRLTVIENVALPLAYKGMTAGRRLKRAAEILERVGLADREYFYPRHLSGGQAQSAAIARALINEPKIIIADEPTGNLDSASSRLVMELLSEIHQTNKTTILFVTHNPELTRYATRVVYMHDGAIVHDEQTTVGQVAKHARQMYSVPTKTEEDDLAGVSALMKARPHKDQPKQTTDKKDKTKKTGKKSKTKKTARAKK
ncbi:MAG TPA: ABC transporter ATP-binding protein [Candidatus Saccharimonadales bacterium]|nr:ABC transporter ATP-binding protein [Candidatus Saccharimonadales bacterium]